MLIHFHPEVNYKDVNDIYTIMYYERKMNDAWRNRSWCYFNKIDHLKVLHSNYYVSSSGSILNELENV